MILTDRHRQIAVFVFAGILGFIIEASFIHYSVLLLKTNTQIPRLISYPLALILTWYVNRTYGFRMQYKPNFKEFFRFIKSNLAAQSSNIILYLLMTEYSSYLAVNPILALVIATAISMIVSFTLYQGYVFVSRK